MKQPSPSSLAVVAAALLLVAAPPHESVEAFSEIRTPPCSRTSRKRTLFTPPTSNKLVEVSVEKQQRRRRTSLLHASDEDGADFHEVSDDDELSDFLNQFQSRKSQVLQRQAVAALKLRKAACSSKVAFVLPDWVRRLSVDYPLAACGSSSDALFLCHLETGRVLAQTKGTATIDDANTDSKKHNMRHASITDERVEHLVHQLYGQYDGGGTVAVALKGTLLCEARRSGGVHVWRLVKEDDNKNAAESSVGGTAVIKLMSQGFVPSLESSLVTALRLEDDYLWVTTDQGTVEAYALDADLPLTLRTQPDLLWKVGGRASSCTVLSLDVHTELGVAVVTTDAGTVELLSLEDDSEDDEKMPLRKPCGSFVPPFDGSERRSSNTYPTCATIVALNSDDSGSNGTDESRLLLNRPQTYAVACGTNDGSLFLQYLKMDDVLGDEIDTERPFQEQKIRSLMPKHFAAVKCLASPAPGLLLTGGLDGTLRLFDADERNFLYQFVGYKVWLGSLWTDGKRIVTDGADNTVIVHDFSADSSGGKNNPSSRQFGDREDDSNEL